LGLPEFGGEEAAETVVVGDAGEAGSGEGRGVIGQGVGAEAGEDAEGKVEAADVGSGDEVHEAGGWNAEVGDEPEGSRGEVRGDVSDEGFEFGLGEAIEKEVGDDEVVLLCWVKSEGVAVVGLEASSVKGAALAEEMEHGGAGVDSVGLEVGVLREETGEEAAVAVAEDEGGFLMGEGGEVVEAGSLESGAEGEVFEPAIRAGYGVEVGGL
jgi:hypothetical protein